MTTNKLYWTLRDLLMQWGVVTRPRRRLRRHPAGTVRARLMHRGARRWFRRLALPQLLRPLV